jgi:hypothetical protein
MFELRAIHTVILHSYPFELNLADHACKVRMIRLALLLNRVCDADSLAIRPEHR